MVGWQIGDDSLYVSGVFNGQSTAGMNRATNRAAVPASLGAFAVAPPGTVEGDVALDLRQAIYYRRSTLPPSSASGGCSASSATSCTSGSTAVTIEQRWYAHRTLASVLIMEVEVLPDHAAATDEESAGNRGDPRAGGAPATTFLKLELASQDSEDGTIAELRETTDRATSVLPPPAPDINFTAIESPPASGAFNISLGWTQLAECPSRDCTFASNLTHVGILASALVPPGGGLWQMTAGVTRAFITVVRTSLETPADAASLTAALEADHSAATAMAANGTLRSSHIAEWEQTVWNSGVELTGQRSVRNLLFCCDIF